MSSDRDRLAVLLREHGTPIPDEGYPGDEYDCCADAILAEFLVIPHSQTRIEYGYRYGDPQWYGFTYSGSRSEAESGVTKKLREPDVLRAEAMSRLVLPWTPVQDGAR